MLLFVDDAKAEIDLVGFLEIRLHSHDLGKGFLGVLQGAISIVEYTDTVPELWFLRRIVGLAKRRNRSNILPLDPVDDTGLAGRLDTPVEDLPSSGSNGL